MISFEAQLAQVYPDIRRYVYYRLNGIADAEDILQEVCLRAYLKYHQIENKDSFKPWLLSIARNQCNDYFRSRGGNREISLEAVPEGRLVYGRRGWVVTTPVEETMDRLSSKDREILELFYWKQSSINDIASRLEIPVGTVKSRLNTARANFKHHYPHPKTGGTNMNKLPKIAPQYTILKLDQPPFSVKWEELPGWMITPRLGETLSWGLYERPGGKRTEYTDMKVTGKVQVHGIEGVEFVAIQYGAEDYYRTGCIDKIERRFAAQLTDTHCRFLAESHEEEGIRKCFTFLDGEDFLNNWGFGLDNCGKEVNLTCKGLLRREGNVITSKDGIEGMDVVGRYAVTINGKTYDTVCVMDISCFDDLVASEQYIDKNGKTVLWRRFNRDDWALARFGGKPWSQKLPDNERLTINGEVFVHWYDCISDYIF